MKLLAILPPGDGGSSKLKIPGFGQINSPAGIPQGGTNSVQNIVQFAIASIFVVAIILCLLFLIYGGIKWITSGGDKAGVEAARKVLTYAVIGLVIVFSSFFILNLITGIFGIKYF